MKLKPTKKDEIIIKDSALVVADHLVDQIAQNIPLLNIAWGLLKALQGAKTKLGLQRAVEWVETARDNPNIFTQDLWLDEKFQDGHAYAFERYIVERSAEKRKIFKRIFLGFAQAEDKEKFPLEKFIFTLSQLGMFDIEVLREVDTSQTGQNYQIFGHNFNRIENIYNLIGIGLLLDVTGNRMGHNPEESPFVKPTFFCREFVKYLTK